MRAHMGGKYWYAQDFVRGFGWYLVLPIANSVYAGRENDSGRIRICINSVTDTTQSIVHRGIAL